MDGSGYARQIREERERVLANVPASARARILGLPMPYTLPVQIVPKPAPTPRAAVVSRRIIVEYPNRPPDVGPSPQTIISAILTATGISLYEYMREGRANIQISRARQMGYWLTVKLRPDMSYPELGRMFCKDHTTILSGRKRGEALKDSAPIRDWLAHPVIVALLEKRGEQ
jgi:hypothetical protein